MRSIFKNIISGVFITVLSQNLCFAGFKDLKWSVQELITNGVPGDIVTLRESPSILYHWLDVDSARRLADKAGNIGKGFPLKRLGSSILSDSYMDLAERPGLFTWTNPVAGIGSGGTDFLYGDHVVKLWMKPGLNVIGVVTKAGESLRDTKVRFEDGVDLIFHVVKTPLQNSEYSVEYKEWAILDGKAVADFTGAPECLRSELAKWRELIMRDDFSFAEEDMHAPAFLYYIPEHRRRFLVPRIDSALSENRKLPQFFQRKPEDLCALK